MSDKKVNLEKILKSYLTIETMRLNNPDYTFNMVLSAMKESCRETLELAAENATIKIVEYSKYGGRIISESDLGDEISADGYNQYYQCNKQSILNTINQIE